MKRLAATALVIVISLLAHAQQSLEYPSATVREEQTVTVDGVTEIWRLQWTAVPKPYCTSYDASAITCPCQGFSYGESGDLYLTRLRVGVEIDRLHLTPLFDEQPAAVVQRWPMRDRDFELLERKDFSRIVSQRPTVQVMHFADYDHDGRQTEFYLQTDAVSCGKSVGVVIGLSKDNPRLHVFGTVSRPDKPLYLQKHEWEALRNAISGPVQVLDWACGDHGAERQTEIRLHWSGEGIEGVRREYTCPSKDESPRLISEEPLGSE